MVKRRVLRGRSIGRLHHLMHVIDQCGPPLEVTHWSVKTMLNAAPTLEWRGFVFLKPNANGKEVDLTMVGRHVILSESWCAV